MSKLSIPTNNQTSQASWPYPQLNESSSASQEQRPGQRSPNQGDPRLGGLNSFRGEHQAGVDQSSVRESVSGGRSSRPSAILPNRTIAESPIFGNRTWKQPSRIEVLAAQVSSHASPAGEIVSPEPNAAQAKLNALPSLFPVDHQHQRLNLTACTDACMNMISTSMGGIAKPLPTVWQRPHGQTIDEVKDEMRQRGFAVTSVFLSSQTRKSGLTSGDLNKILKAANGPLIGFSESHAFVITGVSGDTVHIEDPLWPRKQISIDTLNKTLDLEDPDVLLSFRKYALPQPDV